MESNVGGHSLDTAEIQQWTWFRKRSFLEGVSGILSLSSITFSITPLMLLSRSITGPIERSMPIPM